MVDKSYDIVDGNECICRYFMYDGLKHTCVEAPHIVNVFSFSKAYGMMGWRVGYVSETFNTTSQFENNIKYQRSTLVLLLESFTCDLLNFL